jgi:O-antigen ligase
VSVVVFLGAAALLLAYALPGGAYDIVIRQEYGIVVWWALAVGFAVGVLPRARPAMPVWLLVAAFVAYTVWTAISLGWSLSAERTTAEIARELDYLGVVLLIVSVLDRATWRPAAMGLGFAALLVCALGVASRLVPGAFPADPFAGTALGSRLSYPFGYWNAVGAWAAMSAATGLAWSAHDRVPVRRAVALGLVPVAALAGYLSYSRASVGGDALAVIAVLALSRHRLTAALHCAVAAAASTIAILGVRAAPQIASGTGTRGAGLVLAAIGLAIVIAAAAAVVTSAVGLDRVRLPRRVSGLLVGAVAVAVVIIGAGFVPSLAGKAWRDFRHPAVVQTADPASRLTQLGGSRYYYWQAAVGAFKARPLTGTGAGTFEFSWDRNGATGDFVRNAHSLELENMAELGLSGLLLIVGVMAAAAAVLVRARRRVRRVTSAGAGTALLAAFLVYLLQASVDWMWQSTAVTVLALGGAAVAATRLSHRRPSVRWYVRVAVALAAICAALIQVPGLVSTAAIRRSQAAERAGNAGLAYSWANAAVSAEPWAASPYDQRALVLDSTGRFTAAAADLQQAARREPENFVHWVLLARVETELGHRRTARRDYEQARELRPKALVFQGH